MTRERRAITTLALAVVTAHAAGFAWFQVGGQDVVWDGNTSTRYLSPTTFPPNDPLLDQFIAAMGEWSSVPGAQFMYQYEVNDQDYAIDHFDGYSDTIAVDPADLDPGVIAATYTVNLGAQWYDMDILFSANPGGVGYNLEVAPSCSVLATPLANGYSFVISALHELGHAAGLAHDPLGNEAPGTPWIVATMNPAYPLGGSNGANIIELHADDRAGMRYLYPASSAPAPVRDLAASNFGASLAPGASLPVDFIPAVAQPGDTMVVHSFIENLGTTAEAGVEQGFYLSEDDVIDEDDLRLGGIVWDLNVADAYDFTVTFELEPDCPGGTFTLISRIDDGEAIEEAFEDNNTVQYCAPFVIVQYAPAIEPMPGEVIPEGVVYFGPLPEVSHPINMSPLTWSLDNPAPGMTINANTGRIMWPSPVETEFPLGVIVRATNDAGSDTTLFLLGVESAPDQCPFDLDDDDQIGFGDVLVVLAEWGACPHPCPPTCRGDLTGGPEGPDCYVNFHDLLAILAHWGTCP